MNPEANPKETPREAEDHQAVIGLAFLNTGEFNTSLKDTLALSTELPAQAGPLVPESGKGLDSADLPT